MAAKNLPVVIVTRHPGAVEWIRRQPGFANLEIKAVPHLGVISPATHYVGILPVGLVAQICASGGRFTSLELTFPDASWRGRELTAAEMDACSARLEEYSAVRIR